MHVTRVARLAGSTPDQIRYLEKKKYVKGRWVCPNKRRVRDYPESEVTKIQLIVKYLKQGYRHDVAHQKAMNELINPRLL